MAPCFRLPKNNVIAGLHRNRRCHCEPVLTLVWPPPGIPFGHSPPVLPGTSIEFVGADALIGPRYAPPFIGRVDEGIDPYGFLRRFSKLGSILCPHPSRLRRATFTLWSNCHWQLLDFNSPRGAPPRRGRLGERIATPSCGMVRNDVRYTMALGRTGGLPHQCAHWFAMTAFFLPVLLNKGAYFR